MSGRSSAFIAGLLWLVTTVAHANGRIPGATGLAIHPTDGHVLLLALTYGLALSRDGGASWTWMCEQQIEGNGGDVDPSIVVTSDGSIVVMSLTNGGVLVSRDNGCSFERAMGELQGHRGVDLTLDPNEPGRVLALMSTIVDVVERRPRFRNILAHSLDHGRSWELLAEFPSDLSAETVEVAPSDSDRIYVSGTSGEDPLQGIIERSDDGGRSWTRTTTRLPHGSGSLFLSAIHPSDPDRIWFRVPGRGDIYGVLPARLWLSKDGAASFEQVGDTQGGMLGFALSPDGERMAFGGPLDGLFLAPSDASAAPVKIADQHLSCLRWQANGLYACAIEPNDPYTLGFAAEPTRGFAPVWKRANTCRDACNPGSPLELLCQMPWEDIAPLIEAETAVCEPSASTPQVEIDAGTAKDQPPAAQPTPPAADRARSTKGCSVVQTPGVGTPWWPAVLLLACWRRRLRAAVVAACALGACADAEAVGGSMTEHDDFHGCAQAYASTATGLEISGEHLTVKVLDAMPAEPERYINRWTVELQTPGGSPATAATLVRAQTFMPVHGHDGRVEPRPQPLAEPGRFSLDRLNFSMRGPWEVRLWLRSAAGEEDYVVFDVCVAK